MGKRVGFIGVGAMGGPMAANVLKKGYDLTVFDLRPEPVAKLVALGAKAVGSCKEIAEQCDVVFSSVPEDKHVRAMVFGEEGLLAGAHPGLTLIEMTTASPMVMHEVAAALATKGARAMDAPVMGAVVGAEQGTLTIAVGGDADLFAEHEELIRVMGRVVHHVGPLGCGKIVKIINNLLVATAVPAISEALVLGVKAGMQPDVLVECLEKASCGSWVMSHHIKKFTLNGNFSKGLFGVDYILKDLYLAQELAKHHHLPVHFGALASQLYETAQGTGLVKEYHPSVIKQMEAVAGVKVRNPGVNS